MEEKQFDVALSFAGENRPYVERVAQLLQENGIKVFYDNFNKAELWGRNLIDHLGNIYAEQSRFIVMFISEHYAEKEWNNHERKFAQERAFKMGEDCILPARFDDTEIPGLPATIGYIDLRSTTVEELVELIVEKVAPEKFPNKEILEAKTASEFNGDTLSVTNKIKKNVLDDYEFENQIGAGYFSNVNRYRSKETNQKVAIKRLKKQFKDNINYRHRFEREINLLKKLSGHPNIIEFIDDGLKDERPFYIMPAAETNLDKFISNNNSTLEVADRLFLFEQVLEAVDYAHSQTILHRDISPNNVLLFEDNGKKIVKVSDFGLGKDWAQDSGFTYSVTANYGQRVYTAPEQFNRLKDASEKSDIYSLGKLLDYILTGKVPHVIYTTGGFKGLIEKATNPEPDQRYTNLEEFKFAYKLIKSILLPEDDTDPSELAKFTKDDGNIDWDKFHKFALKGEYTEHVYGEYINIITELLIDESNTKKYITAAPDDGQGFVQTFRQKIKELPSTGWPFKDISKFASVLRNIFFFTSDDETKFLCLQEMWKYAYEQDQWGAQRIIKRIIIDNQIPLNLQERFAVEILHSEAKNIDVTDFNGVNIPGSIKRAIFAKRK